MSAPKKLITIHDIARELGISASTVSRSLNNNTRISKATRDAVQRMAAMHDYQPNKMAASLRMGSGNTVGVIVPNINRKFFASIISGIEQVLSQEGYNLMICQSNELREKEEKALATLLDARVDGILMSLSMETKSYEHIETAMRRGTQMVFFDRIPENLEVDSVVINDYQAAYKLTSKLIKQGYKRIAHVGGSRSINVYRNRNQGYRDALLAAHIEINEEWIIETSMTVEGGSNVLEDFVLAGNIPDAVVCAGDFAALGILQSAKKHSIEVPGHLLLSGFANEDFTSLISPKLTSVDQRGKDIGRFAAKRFLDKKKNMPTRKIELEAKIIYRSSTNDNTE